MISSANKESILAFLWGCVSMPFMPELLSLSERASMVNTKSAELIGSPWRQPRCMSKKSDLCPPLLVHSLKLLSRIVIHFLILSPNP